MKQKVLILEDDERLAKSLKHDFEDHGYDAIWANRIADIPRLKNFIYAIVDLRLAAGDFGLDAVRVIKERSPDAKIIILSGYGSITTAVEAVKRGATDYLTKPVSFLEIERALKGERVAPQSDFQRRSLSQIEHEYIDFILTKNEGNISRTAKDLGLHRQSLQRKLKKYTT